MKKLLSVLLAAALLLASSCQAPEEEPDTTFYEEVTKLVTEEPPPEVAESGEEPEDCRVLVWSPGETPDLWSLKPVTVLTRDALAVVQFRSSQEALSAVESLCAIEGVTASLDSPLEAGEAPLPEDSGSSFSSSASTSVSGSGTSSSLSGQGGGEHPSWSESLSWGVDYVGFREFAHRVGTFSHVPTVAVVDTGIDSTHERLQPLLDQERTLNVSGSSTQEDVFGHGTHVAGIIADAAGEVPIRLLSIKALGDDGTGNQVSAASAVLYAMEQNCDVLNLSFVGPHNMVLDEAIAHAMAQGCQVVCSAGNEGHYIEERFDCPGHITTPGLLVVGSCGPGEERSQFSNFGPSVDLMAPGEDIRSTWPGGYETLSGTSMACPMVSGAAALIKACNPGLTPETVEAMLKVSLNDAGILDLRLLDPQALNPAGAPPEPEGEPEASSQPESTPPPSMTLPVPNDSSSGESSSARPSGEDTEGYVVNRPFRYLEADGLYTGFWSAGRPEGMGKMVFQSEGSRFRSLDGVWNGGEFMVGTGVQDLPAGIYEGGILRSVNPDGTYLHVQHGTGTITQPDGSVYDIIYNLGQELYSSQPTGGSPEPEAP